MIGGGLGPRMTRKALLSSWSRPSGLKLCDKLVDHFSRAALEEGEEA